MSATTDFLEYLAANGPQTFRQLESKPFWGGVRTRIPALVKQGRVIRCEVANPETGFHFKAVVRAYKVPEGVFTGNIRTFAAEKRMADESARKAAAAAARVAQAEARKLQKLAPMIEAAKKLLEANGYTVTPNGGGQRTAAPKRPRQNNSGYSAGPLERGVRKHDT